MFYFTPMKKQSTISMDDKHFTLTLEYLTLSKFYFTKMEKQSTISMDDKHFTQICQRMFIGFQDESLGMKPKHQTETRESLYQE